MQEDYKKRFRDNMIKYLSQLVGYTVVATVEEDDEEEGYYDGPFFGLLLKSGKKEIVAWIQSDEEGNGPGFLSIQKEN